MSNQRQVKALLQIRQFLQQSAANYSASPLAGRNFLAGAMAKTFPKFLPKARHDIPYVFKARNVKRTDLEHFAQNFRPILDSLLKQHGIVMIRGWEMYTENDFSRFLNELSYKIMRNIPGLGEARREIGLNVYGGRMDPPEVTIEPHQEHSYLVDYPHLFVVHCEDPVEVDCGGDYIVVHVKDVQRQLDKQVLEKFDRLGVLYHRQLPCSETSHLPSWRQVMRTMCRDVVGRRLAQHGFKHHWDDQGTLHYSIKRPAFAKYFRTGEKLWFNQITTQHWTFHSNHPSYANSNLEPSQYPSNTFYGDGSEIEIDVIQHIRDVIWDNAVCFQFKRGDVLIMDNMMIQHGRLAWTGKRKISVGLAKYP